MRGIVQAGFTEVARLSTTMNSTIIGPGYLIKGESRLWPSIHDCFLAGTQGEQLPPIPATIVDSALEL